MKGVAEAQGDLAVAIRCNREILRHGAMRMAVLEKLGLFNGLALGQVLPDSRSRLISCCLVSNTEA